MLVIAETRPRIERQAGTVSVGILADMEVAGVRVDRRKLGELSRDFDQRLTGLIKEIYVHSEGPFNINSPQQLCRILFDTLGLTPDKEIVTHCQTHHRSGLTYLIAKALGYPRVKGYAGSWGEWGNHPDTPVEI